MRVGQHMPECRGDGLGGRRAVGQFRQDDEHLDEQGLRERSSGSASGATWKSERCDRPLRASDPEELPIGLKERRLAGGVRADHRGDVWGEGHRGWLGTEAAEAGEGDAFEAQGNGFRFWSNWSKTLMQDRWPKCWPKQSKLWVYRYRW